MLPARYAARYGRRPPRVSQNPHPLAVERVCKTLPEGSMFRNAYWASQSIIGPKGVRPRAKMRTGEAANRPLRTIPHVPVVVFMVGSLAPAKPHTSRPG